MKVTFADSLSECKSERTILMASQQNNKKFWEEMYCISCVNFFHLPADIP
jgi:hypothetical protein